MSKKTALVRATVLVLAAILLGGCGGQGREQWFRGNIHAHSFWSDGRNFPELVGDLYKSSGYQFLILTDHNILSRGERWKDYDLKSKDWTVMLARARRRFGDRWVETRVLNGKHQVRLKTCQEVAARLNDPGRFLLIQGEEITTSFAKRTQIHVNMLGCVELIKPLAGQDESDTLVKNVAAVHEQALAADKMILPMVNHPNWPRYSLTAEDLAEVGDPCLLEILNPWNGALFRGNARHPCHERLWDIANTLRLVRGRDVLYGTATDDSHDYSRMGPTNANVTQGWVMVRAKELSEKAILRALTEGDFYFTNGLELEKLEFDASAGELRVSARVEPGVHYAVEFYGTPEGCDLSSTPVTCRDPDGKPGRASRKYSAEIGKRLARVEGPSGTYRLTGREMFVRAVVRSDRKMVAPPQDEMEYEAAFTQPVGWRK